MFYTDLSFLYYLNSLESLSYYLNMIIDLMNHYIFINYLETSLFKIMICNIDTF